MFIMKNLSMHKIDGEGLQSFTLQLTKKCNLNCKFCGQAVSRIVKKERYELPRGKISEVLKDAKKCGALMVNLTGGEPTLRMDLISIIKEASSLGLKVNLLTNGYLLNESYCNKLKSAGLNQLSVSVHSPFEDKHDAICSASGCYKRLNDSILYLKSIKPELRIAATYTINTLNYFDSYRMLLLARKTGIDCINFSQIIFLDSMTDSNLKLSKIQMEEFYFKIVPLLLRDGKKFGIKVRITPLFPSLLDKPIVYQLCKLIEHPDDFDKEIDDYLNEEYNSGLYKSFPCITALNSSRIQANGEVTICCDSEDARFNLGNINNQRFFDIWNSEKYKKIRDINFYPKSEVCKVCKRQFIQE